jgi:hypothetical protein
MKSTNQNNTTETSLLQSRLLSDARVKSGVDLIAEERQRQIEYEGYSPQEDANYVKGELADAAACYAGLTVRDHPLSFRVPNTWPWITVRSLLSVRDLEAEFINYK